MSIETSGSGEEAEWLISPAAVIGMVASSARAAFSSTSIQVAHKGKDTGAKYSEGARSSSGVRLDTSPEKSPAIASPWAGVQDGMAPPVPE